MALLTIRTYPDEILKKQCEEVLHVGDDERRLIDDMFETMVQNQGVGLAAPQVGVLKNIIVAAPEGPDKELYAFINPVITKKKGEFVDIEGCLSVPCSSAEVTRARKVWVEALDKKGKRITITVSDLFARIIQHEGDHLKGILFIDYLGFQARKEIIDCARKVKKL
ncbi:MAG: peptide deformylase [Candidatus Omnitrophica bacterium]|nr:peptide deformylase [Candidatus Omnitrophota bacterium]